MRHVTRLASTVQRLAVRHELPLRCHVSGIASSRPGHNLSLPDHPRSFWTEAFKAAKKNAFKSARTKSTSKAAKNAAVSTAVKSKPVTTAVKSEQTSPTPSATPPPVVPVQQTLTWRDYDPDGGLPLAAGDLSPSILQSIFEEPIDEELGNWILRLVNWRRQSGALIDLGIEFGPHLGIAPAQVQKALHYLRTADPAFDERGAGITWAEEQIQELSNSNEYIERALELGLYKRAEGDTSVLPESQTDAVYGRSELVAWRTENDAKAKEAERVRLEEEEKAQEAERAAAIAAQASAQASASASSSADSNTTGPASDATSVATPDGAAQAVGKREKSAWLKYYEENSAVTDLKDPPPMTTTRRLLPSFLLTLLVLYGCYLLHENYTPPPRSERWFPDTSPAATTIGALVGSMVVVLAMYRWPPLWRFCNTYFVSVPAYPFAVSTVLATFTHQTFSHLFFNSIILWAFGTYLYEDVGRGSFLATFLATGTFGNFFALAWNVWFRKFHVYAYGSSTGVYGVVAATCLLRADHDAEIFGHKLPLTGMLLLAGLVLTDVLLFLKGGALAASIGFAAHAGAYASGIACAGLVRWQARSGSGPERVDAGEEEEARGGSRSVIAEQIGR